MKECHEYSRDGRLTIIVVGWTSGLICIKNISDEYQLNHSHQKGTTTHESEVNLESEKKLPGESKQKQIYRSRALTKRLHICRRKDHKFAIT